jgi:Pyruvate/2-oxoacid:ferredoxin oxidoreductase delta subunit
MSRLKGRNLRVVLYEGPGSRPLDGGLRRRLIGTLLEAGYELSRVVDGDELSSSETAVVIVLGQFSEGRPPMIDLAGNGSAHYRELRGMNGDQVVAELQRVCEAARVRRPGAWTPWFPVIDYERCTNCKQCLSFCLFGVYAVDEDERVHVRHPDRCKTNCPACARVCPSASIVFPKYGQAPINGDSVRPEDVDRQAMKVDVSALLGGGDIHSRLRQRSSTAGRKLRDVQADLAIPDEVIASLSAERGSTKSVRAEKPESDQPTDKPDCCC